MKTAPDGYPHIFVAVDKFTKWIEVVVTSIESTKDAEFMEKITHRFGEPNRIITDLGVQFTLLVRGERRGEGRGAEEVPVAGRGRRQC